MEIREYDTSYDLLNRHLSNKNLIYGIKRYPPIFLKDKNKMIEIIKNKWNFNDDFFKEHVAFFAFHKHVQNHYPLTDYRCYNIYVS
jgi:hypothetical protein